MCYHKYIKIRKTKNCKRILLTFNTLTSTQKLGNRLFISNVTSQFKLIIIPWRYRSLRACQPTARFTSTCPQTQVNDHSAYLGGGEWDQHVEFPSRYWLSSPGLSLKISSYSISSRCWVTLIPYTSQKIGDRTSGASHGLRQRKLYTRVTVTPAPVRVPPQRPLVPSFTSVCLH